MEAILSQQRIIPAIAACAVGIAVSSLIHTPFGLLAPMVALYLLATDRTGLALHAALAAGLAGSLLVTALYEGEARDSAATWAAFFALAICIGALVTPRTSASPDAEAWLSAMRRMTGEQAPSYPVIGPTLEEKATPRHSPLVSISAQDDKSTTAQLAAVSFWAGLPFHLRYWRHQADGRYRWVESRSEPLREASGTRLWRAISTEIDDQRSEKAPPTKIASNPPSNDDAVRAAKIVENLLGNAWAFDAAGRPTYLTPLAQTFVAVTLEEFQAAVDDGHTFFKRTAHPDDYDRISAEWRRSLQTGEPFFLDRRVRRASGIHEWNRTGFVPTRDRHGRITGWYGSMIDLDSHRIAQAELRDRERELSHLVNMVPSHIWRLTRDGEPIFFNKRMVDFLGLDVADSDKPGRTRLQALIETTIHPDDSAGVATAFNHCLATGEHLSMRYRLRRGDGVYRWMSSRAEPMRDQDGHIIQWYGLCQDIEDQMQAEEALRRSERQLQQLIDTVPAIMWSTTPEGIPCYLNKQAAHVIGATLDDLIAPDGSRSLTIIHPDDRDAIDQAMTRSFEAGASFVGRYRQRRADGAHRWVESRAEPLRDDSGTIVQWYGVSVDIHDLVTAQEALRDREREFSQLIDMVPIHIRRMTPQGEPTFFNKRLMDFFGLADMADLEKPGISRLAAFIQTLVHPDDAARLLETARRSFASGEPFSLKYRMRRADGAYRWVDTRGEPLRNQSGAIVQWYVVSLDIDDEMSAEEALRRSERQLQQLVDAVPVMIWSTTPEGRPSYVNKRFTHVTGATLEDITAPDGSFNLSVIHPDDKATTAEMVGRSFGTGTPYVIQYRQLRRGGSYRWTETRAEALRDDSGTILQWYGVSVDIHDMVTAQEAMRRSERELSQLVNMVPVYIRRLTPEGEPTFFNKRLTDFIGVDLAGIGTPGMGRLAPAVENFIHPDEAAKLLAAVRHSVATGEGYSMKYRLRRADGVYRWIETRAEPVRNQDGTIAQWYSISIDVDDEVRAQQTEEALRETSDKLAKATQAASLAELSASIAHEVNQPLAAIVANSHACQRWLSAEPPNFERAKLTVERVIRDANSAADVVGRIRALFKQSVETRTSTALPGVISEARNLMAEEAARRRVRIDLDAEDTLPLVAFDRVQLQQVLINLIRNGMDAMDSISGDRILAMRVRRMGDVVQTEISDRGRGIEFPEKIFEPFFTTKSNGMGMGLAICRSIVESHGGRLWAQNNEPNGATFIFTLPAEEKAAS